MELQFLSKDIIDKYKNLRPPMTELGEFVYVRTYSRYLPDKKRRETWLETIVRTIEYSLSLELEFLKNKFYHLNLDKVMERMKKEAEELLDSMFHLRLFASGRTMWVGGTEVAKEYPLSNFNCSFMVLDSYEAFAEMFYLLMLGSGVGFRTMPYDVENIPPYRVNVKTTHKPYRPVPKNLRQEDTTLEVNDQKATVTIGDSKEGWVNALISYFDLRSKSIYHNIEEIQFVYDNVRPAGERLKRFGGTASGYKSIQRMFTKIAKVMDKGNGKLKPIDVLDIGNIIAENVVSGGVRRSSEMNLASADDHEIENAKNNMYFQDTDGTWKENHEILHRRMSNNSIFYESKPSREQLHQNFVNMRYTGERGLVNAESARRRRKNFNGLNPCAEILLDSQQVCNLTTNNVYAYVENGKLNKEKMFRGFALTTRIGIRQTLPTLELPRWDKKQVRDRLIGVSITGWFDMVDAVGLSKKEQEELLRELRQVVRETAKEYCAELGINEPLLATTIKPEGTISQLPTVSSGVHRAHAPYYIRRVRISATDPLAKVAMKLDYPVFPETGQTWENADTLVIEFPVKSPSIRTKFDVSAIEQLETYKMFQQNYTEHNTSITVTVRDHEWEEVEQWVWDNWDDFVAISFLPLDDAVYPLAPYEAITEEEYNKRKQAMKPFDASLLTLFENGLDEFDIGTDGCEGGACPVR